MKFQKINYIVGLQMLLDKKLALDFKSVFNKSIPLLEEKK
jgi:hypothetical protein